MMKLKCNIWLGEALYLTHPLLSLSGSLLILLVNYPKECIKLGIPYKIKKDCKDTILYSPAGMTGVIPA